MEAELSSDIGVGVTSWLITGLRIQELQYVLHVSMYSMYNLLQNNPGHLYLKTGQKALRGATLGNVPKTWGIEATN